MDTFDRIKQIVDSTPDEEATTEAVAEHTEEPQDAGNAPAESCGDKDCAEEHTHEAAADESQPTATAEGKGDEPDDKSAVDVRKPTKDEQKEYAFAKLTRKNSALRKQIAELERKNRELEERVQKPLRREDFKSDTDLSAASLNQLLDQRDLQKMKETLAQQKAELDASEAEEIAERVNRNIEECFPTKEAIDDYHEVVGNAMKAGFDKFLDETEQGQSIVSFCNTSPVGSKIIYHLAKNPKDFVTLMKSPNPQVQASRLAVLEQRIGTEATTYGQKDVRPQATPKNALPHSGKLKTSAPPGEVDDEEAIALIRRLG